MSEKFRADFDVSRETFGRLTIYADLLAKWNPKINLVSRASLDELWTRHIADSAQVWALSSSNPEIWADLGSGGGFPGLVIGILAADASPTTKVNLIESDIRKCAFLNTVARECGIKVAVHAERIELATLSQVDVISARALAPLRELLAFAEKLRRPEGICLFPKGETVHKEIADASRSWSFEYRLHPSRTDPRAAIVEIGAFARV